MVFTALQIGRASSFAGDVSKAKVSAARIFSLLKQEPEIDTESPDGLKPVGRIQTVLLQRSSEVLGLELFFNANFSSLFIQRHVHEKLIFM